MVVLCRGLVASLASYLLDADGITQLLLQVLAPKMSPGIARISWGTKLHLLENHCPRESKEQRYG